MGQIGVLNAKLKQKIQTKEKKDQQQAEDSTHYAS